MHNRTSQQGQANLTAVFLFVGLIVTGVWIWKRLLPETQDYVIDQALPLIAAAMVILVGAGLLWRNIRTRRLQRARRTQLMQLFERAVSQEKKLEIAFALIEVNEYRREGLDPVAPALQELLATTLQRSLGDKQHRIRGMAASHLGVLQYKESIPFLLQALEDDHAYVRACAALGLGRLRAFEAKDKLAQVMNDDWDQTVRSRAREALERLV